MSEMSSGAALRQLQQAQAGLKKARQVMKLARGDAGASPNVIKVGWESLVKAHRLLAADPALRDQRARPDQATRCRTLLHRPPGPAPQALEKRAPRPRPRRR